MNRALTWIIAALAAVAIAAACNLDGPDDNSAEWDQSENLKALQASEPETARREAAAQALCNEVRGPNSEARWDADGKLGCTTRKGMRAAL